MIRKGVKMEREGRLKGEAQKNNRKRKGGRRLKEENRQFKASKTVSGVKANWQTWTL